MSEWFIRNAVSELPNLADVAKVEEEGAQLLEQALHLQRLPRLLTLTDQQI